MEIIAGKAIFTALDEIVDPAHTALIVVDLQNDFCALDGLWGSLGLDLTMTAKVLPNVQRLIAGARRAAVPVIYIQMTNLPDLASQSPSRLRYSAKKLRLTPEQVICKIGSWGAEFLPEIAPQPVDLVIQKWRYSAFDGTPLDQVLRSKGVQTVVVCGATTSVCVEGTARDAFTHDYYTVLPTDCVSDVRQDWHEASLLLMQSRVDEVTSDEVIAAWDVELGQGFALEPRSGDGRRA
jgi:nicotinamidase-related amidase